MFNNQSAGQLIMTKNKTISVNPAQEKKKKSEMKQDEMD